MALAAVGAAVGLGCALLAARALRSLLFEVSPHDPAALALVTLLLAAAALAACWMPVRSALRVNPAVALRAD
jgi:putative ABC transport system permease protein